MPRRTHASRAPTRIVPGQMAAPGRFHDHLTGDYPPFPPQLFAKRVLQRYVGVMASSSITPSAAGLRTLSHPTRLRMLGLLRLEGPATATQLAQRLELNTGATSYHLRQLAEHGFIVEDTERGDGARPVVEGRAPDAPAPTSRPASEDEDETTEAYLQTVALMYTEHAHAAPVRAPATSPGRGRTASTTSDWHLRLTPARAEQLVDALAELVDELARGGGRRRRRRHLRGQPQRVPAAGHGGPGRGRAVTGAARAALRLADRGGDLAPRHPGLDDRDPVVRADHHRVAPPRPAWSRLAEMTPLVLLQGARRPAARPGRRPPDGHHRRRRSRCSPSA